eukprot:CAMPEP_0174234772 /NCGR_PEP_ID=MMETSP0417-20130205/4434_1 /TAXON_ID=242541 /ORGANISM="Mayorella sp, Strain BSH-02190019" /LENGTH=185 /DNA_ID=CAMNT_0015313183 /DNA_START=129 /DNA_END=686 /DNA_ORIENTATION=-
MLKTILNASVRPYSTCFPQRSPVTQSAVSLAGKRLGPNERHSFVRSKYGPRSYLVGMPRNLAVKLPPKSSLVHVSGVFPLDPATGKVPSSLEEQSKQVLNNLDALLREAESGIEGVVSAQVFMRNAADFHRVNHFWKETFFCNPPVRDIIGVTSFTLPEALIQVSVVAQPVHKHDTRLDYLMAPW